MSYKKTITLTEKQFNLLWSLFETLEEYDSEWRDNKEYNELLDVIYDAPVTEIKQSKKKGNK